MTLYMVFNAVDFRSVWGLLCKFSSLERTVNILRASQSCGDKFLDQDGLPEPFTVKEVTKQIATSV